MSYNSFVWSMQHFRRNGSKCLASIDFRYQGAMGLILNVVRDILNTAARSGRLPAMVVSGIKTHGIGTGGVMQSIIPNQLVVNPGVLISGGCG